MARHFNENEERNFLGAFIPRELYFNPELSWTEKILLIEINSLSKCGECYASNQHFADFLGVSKKTIEKMIPKLVKSGYIKSKLIYKNDTSKQIVKRILTLTDAVGYTTMEPYPQKSGEATSEKYGTPTSEKAGTPTSEKGRENNTSVLNNTTINNTKEKYTLCNKYNGAKSEFCTTDEFSFDVVERQIRKACSEQYPFDDVDTVVAIFKYYYSMYYENVGEHHPKLNQANIEGLVYRIVSGTDIVKGYDIDTYIALIDEHFAENYSKEPDWNINHFLGGKGVLRGNRFYETCY